MERDAFDALDAALAAVGLSASVPRRGNPRADVVVETPDGRSYVVGVRATSIATAEQVDRIRHRRGEGVVPILIADQVPVAARRELNDGGISWLDRRGHLRLTAPGLFVDADVPASPRGALAPVGRAPITGRSGLAAASALLLDPEEPMGVSEIARVAELNPSSITRSLTAIADAHLAERRGRGAYRALVPELFWALADVWPRDRTIVRWAGSPSDPGGASWVAGGVRAALEWGAPIVATADLPIDLYVPDERTIRRLAVQHEGGEGSEVRLTADPNGLVTRDSFGSPSFAWPLAHPLFCALDLTSTARDREALEQWTPPERFTRVW
jgi:hypothetical protein